MDIAVILDQIECVRTSQGPGADDIYIVTELWDNGNTGRPLIKRTLSHIGDMRAGDIKKQRDNPNLGLNEKPPIQGDDPSYLAWVPAGTVSIDSLECYMLVIKAGNLTSFETGPNDKYDTHAEAQKAEADVTDGLKEKATEEKDKTERDLSDVEKEATTATGARLKELQDKITALKSKIRRLQRLIEKISKGLSLGGEVLELIVDIITIVLAVKGSAGSTVALGQDWWGVIPPNRPPGVFPTQGPHHFECTDNSAIYNIDYKVRVRLP